MPSTLDQAATSMMRSGRHIFRFQPGSASSQRSPRPPSPSRLSARRVPSMRSCQICAWSGAAQAGLIPTLAGSNSGEARKVKQRLVFEGPICALPLRRDADPPNHVVGARDQVNHLAGGGGEGGAGSPVSSSGTRPGRPGQSPYAQGRGIVIVSARAGPTPCPPGGGRALQGRGGLIAARHSRWPEPAPAHAEKTAQSPTEVRGHRGSQPQGHRAGLSRLRWWPSTYERSLAAAQTAPGRGDQPWRGRTGARPPGSRLLTGDDMGTQSRLPRLALVNGNGEQAQGAQYHPACRGQGRPPGISRRASEQTITFDEPH